MAGKQIHDHGEWSDEEPPLLGDDDVKQESAAIGLPLSNQQQEDGGEAGPSIMDEMVAVATQAKAAKRQQQSKERDSKGFGTGLKKGFFNQSKVTKQQQPQKKKSTASTATAGRTERLEVGETSSKKETALRIVDSPGTNQTSDAPSDGSSSFVFPEVQDALKSMDQLNPNEWMNDQFFTKIAKHPKLLQALQNPRFTQAINELQQNPQAAMLKYQRDPDVSLMLRDFMEFLGNHFEELGKQQDKHPQQTQPSTVVTQPSTAPPASPSIVDLDETRRQAIANMARAPEEEAQVQRILENPELLAALSDAKLMEQLRQCQQDPRALQSLARDPVLGPKLRLLVEAKMVAFG